MRPTETDKQSSRIPSLQMRFFQNCPGRKMRRKSKKPMPSFFKILILDFTRQLRLPPVFVNKYGSDLPEKVKLRISNSFEKTWKVKLEEMEDNHHFFTHGWNKFVRDVGLKMGEFLVFHLTATAVFRVSIYEMTGCRREFPIPDGNFNAHDMDNKRRSRPGIDGMSELEEGNPLLYYEITLKLYQRARLTLRTRFVEAAGLRRRQHIKLEYLPGHRHQVVSMNHREEPQHRTDLLAGWTAFRKANMVVGKTYSLEFIPDKNVIQVKEVATDK